VLLRLRDNESLSWDELADRAGISSRYLFRLLAARTVSEPVADRSRVGSACIRRSLAKGVVPGGPPSQKRLFTSP